MTSWVRLVGALCLSSLPLLACASSEEPAAGSQTGMVAATATPTAEDVCVRLEEAFFRRRWRCILPVGATPPAIGAQARYACETFADAARAGRVSVDARKLEACVAEVDASSCVNDNWRYDPVHACAGMIVRRADTDACHESLECGAGAHCDAPDTFCTGQCHPDPTEGERCGAHFACAYGLGCTSTPSGPSCLVPTPRPHPIDVTLLGASCSDDDDMCEPGARCRDGRCIKLAAHGERCDAPNDCEDGFCETGVCMPYRRPGEACAYGRQCIAYMACVDGACTGVCLHEP